MGICDVRSTGRRTGAGRAAYFAQRRVMRGGGRGGSGEERRTTVRECKPDDLLELRPVPCGKEPYHGRAPADQAPPLITPVVRMSAKHDA